MCGASGCHPTRPFLGSPEEVDIIIHVTKRFVYYRILYFEGNSVPFKLKDGLGLGPKTTGGFCFGCGLENLEVSSSSNNVIVPGSYIEWETSRATGGKSYP